MPRRSKTEKRRRLAADLAYRGAMLAALGVFLFVLLNSNSNNPQSFSTSLIIATIAMVIVMFAVGLILYRVLKGIFVPKSTPQFDFDNAPPPAKNQRAREFEYDVAALIHQLTGRRTEVVGGSGDGGIDIKVYEDAQWVGIVQCKNLAPNKFLYPSYIRDLNTVRHYHQVRTAYLVTTGRISDDSRQLAKELGVRLIDGDELKQLRRKAMTRAKSSNSVPTRSG